MELASLHKQHEEDSHAVMNAPLGGRRGGRPGEIHDVSVDEVPDKFISGKKTAPPVITFVMPRGNAPWLVEYEGPCARERGRRVRLRSRGSQPWPIDVKKGE